MTAHEPGIFNRALELYNEGKFKEGYTLVTEHAPEYPEYLDTSFYYRLCLIAKSGDLTLAEEVLEDALDQGYYFSEKRLKEEEDLKEMQGREFYERLVARDLEMLRQAQRNAKPLLQILRPDHTVKDGRKRFLMSLHGNNGSLKRFLPTWEFIPRTDWLTAIPQSSQVGGSGSFIWDDEEIALKEVKNHYQTVIRHYDPDPALSMICGFSRGGHVALHAALEQTFPIASFLLVCPYIGEIEAWLPMIEAAQGKGLRGHFLLGELDEPITTRAKAMQKVLEEHGMKVGVDVFEGVWHDFPPDFEHVFDRVTREMSEG